MTDMRLSRFDEQSLRFTMSIELEEMNKDKCLRCNRRLKLESFRILTDVHEEEAEGKAWVRTAILRLECDYDNEFRIVLFPDDTVLIERVELSK